MGVDLLMDGAYSYCAVLATFLGNTQGLGSK
jgi:hypothetical protein